MCGCNHIILGREEGKESTKFYFHCVSLLLS